MISLVLRRHGPEKHPPCVHVDPLVGRPAEHVVDVRDDACAGPQLAQQPRLDALVERRTEVERDDSGGAEVRGEEIALMNWTRCDTPATRALAFDSATSCGLISIPTPRAPYFFAAAITIRPSPEPRSYTMSALVTLAAVSIASTTSSGVATKRTSGRWVCASAMRATAPVETASGTNAVTMSAIFPTEAATLFARHRRTLPPSRKAAAGKQVRYRASPVCPREDLHILKFGMAGLPADRGKHVAVG